jgi:hypothetical protein
MDAGGIITFTVGIAIGVSAIAPLVGYALTGWWRECRGHAWEKLAHRFTLSERDFAIDAISIAQGRAESANEALIYVTRRLAVARQHITDIEPLANTGRKLIARRKKQDADRRVARANRNG